MKVLIADDERLVRYGLKSMLEEIGVPARSISAASDGEEMLQMAARLAPDIAFVDIRMPRMDGLAGIERGRLVSPGTCWIILTSHSSFDYAKRALELGAAEYLLKPVSPEDLRRVIGKMEGERRRDLLRANDEFESRLNSLLHNTLSLSQEQREFISDARFQGALVLFDGALEERALADRQLTACREIRSRIISTVDSRLRIALCTLPEGHLALVGAWQPDAEEAAAREAVRGLLKTLQVVLDSAGGEALRVTVMAGRPCASFAELPGELAAADRLAPLRAALGIGRLILLADAEDAERRLAPLCRSINEVVLAWRQSNRLEFLAAVQRARKTFEGLAPLSHGDPVIQNIERFLRFSVGVQPPSSPQEDGWIRSLESQGETIQAFERGDGPAGLVDQALSFIGSNYMNDVGVAQIAYRLGVTPNYLSTLFHSVHGETFVRYVTRLRMEKARDLLSGGIQVQDAARAVGYSSVRHFSRLFLKHFGRYPSEIRHGSSAPPDDPQPEKNAQET